MTERPYHHGDLRAALLSAAEAELADKGVEGFSLRSVAKRAGVTHAAPAHHFGDVAGLLTALATEGFLRFQTALDAREEGAADPREKAIHAAFGYLDFALSRPALFRLIFSSAKPDFANSGLNAAAETAYRHLVALITGLGGRDSDVVALWAASHGLADLALGGRLRGLSTLAGPEREAIVRSVISRVLPPAG